MTRRHALEFTALCLLAGSGWIVDEFSPPVLDGMLRVAVHMGLLAMLFALGWLFKRNARISPRLCLEVTLGGVALIVPPSLISFAASGKVTSLDEELCFVLIPALVVFLTAQSSVTFGAAESPLRLLIPALAALGGAALLLPFTMPPTAAGKAWLGGLFVAALLSAYAAVRLHRSLAGVGVLPAAVMVAGAAAIVAAVFYRVGYLPVSQFTAMAATVEALRCVLLEGPALLLTVWLLREMQPVAVSTRYLLVPLVTIVESYVIERPHADWTVFAGMILMGGGSFLLLRGNAQPAPDRAL